MSHSRTIKLGAFNIVTHPHKEEWYNSIFLRGLALRHPVKVYGDKYAILQSAQLSSRGNHRFVFGNVATYIGIDPKLDWYDIESGEQADEIELGKISIPENLRPNLRRFAYVFFPDRHTFFYVQYDSHAGSFGTTSMQRFLQGLLSEWQKKTELPIEVAEARLIQERESIATIFQQLNVHRLDITLLRPNGDTSDDAERSIEEEFEEQNIVEYFGSYKSNRETPLKPNARTTHLMNEATTNGHVVATGTEKDTGLVKTYDTKDRPFVSPMRMSDADSYFESLISYTAEVLGHVNRPER